MKIGITGGSGFIGSSLANHLSRFYEIKILDVVEPRLSKPNIHFERCDITDKDAVRKALEDVDAVIHTAIIQIPKINENPRLGYMVNIVGTQNVCEAVDENLHIKGMILAGSWHVIGESGLSGLIDEGFGYRPDKVEERARLYALAKMAQEIIVRYYDEMSNKVFGVIRMGTVLGEGMPEKTAANIFIERGLRGEPITPFKHSMYRPMLYVDINDVCRAFEQYIKKILNGEIKKEGGSLSHIVNLYYPDPITILELAEIVRDAIVKATGGRVNPPIEIVDHGLPPLFDKDDKYRFKVDVSRALKFLGMEKLTHPRESIERIVKARLESRK
ncbi:MAG: NAD-dependent epimerase/dehydratase family protein [Candidatus Baldrarchaeia archaeon]